MGRGADGPVGTSRGQARLAAAGGKGKGAADGATDAANARAAPAPAETYPAPRFLPLNLEHLGDSVSLLRTDPPVYSIRGFLSGAECDALVKCSEGRLARAPVVGKGTAVNSFGYVQGESEGRTSSTCTLAKSEALWLVERVEALTGLPRTHQEAPQVGCYQPGQRFNAHFDSVEPNSDIGRKFMENGGQRICTVLLYLNTPDEGSNRRRRGGQTTFKTLGLSVQPERGSALIFYPATLDGTLDRRALHSGDPPRYSLKWVSQIWIRQSGNRRDAAPSRRIGGLDGL